MSEDPSLRRLASRIFDAIGESGINVLVYAVGREAEGGWELLAFDEAGTERWRVKADRLYDAAVELAVATGLDICV